MAEETRGTPSSGVVSRSRTHIRLFLVLSVCCQFARYSEVGMLRWPGSMLTEPANVMYRCWEGRWKRAVFVRAGLGCRGAHGSSLSAAGRPLAAGEVQGRAPQELFPGGPLHSV